jgi:hypothetical protein
MRLLRRFQEEFGDEFGADGVRAVDAETRIELELEHALGGFFSPRGRVEIVVGAASPKPKVSFSAVPSLSGDEVEQLEVQLRVCLYGRRGDAGGSTVG